MSGQRQHLCWQSIALAFCFLGLLAGRLGAATFTATLDRDTITLGENATLSLTFDGGTPTAMPAFPDIPNLQIVASGTSTQFTLNNGQSSSSETHTFRVAPRQPGDYAIPALAVDIGGQKLASQPLTLKVLKASAPPPEAINSGSQLAFVKLVLPKSEVYVGESFTAQFQFYFHSQVRNIIQFQQTAFPADGFNVLQMGQIGQGQRRQVQVGNAIYTVFPVSFALKAVKAGPLSLGPVTFNVVVELPSATRQRDPFELFFNRSEQKQVALATEAESVNSLPLPREHVPPSFNGAVGNYTMTLTAGPTNVAVGDPITVKIQITGRGSLDSLSLPEQPAWGDFKTYPPTTKLEPPNALLQGTKTFEQIVTPQNPDLKALPAVSFSFFDPEQKTYRTLRQPPVPLTIRPGGSTPAPSVAGVTRSAQDNNTPPAQDIVPNKQRLGTVGQIGPPLALQRWFLAVQAIPALAFVSAVFWRRQTERLANNPRLRRYRQTAQIIRDGLAQLRQSASRNQGDEFFATLFRLLQEQLGERLDLPATAITEAVIEERLRPRGVPETILAPLQELFQSCNLARYAPVKSSEELAAIIPRFEAVLRQVQGLKL